jgi:hypothetical protein
MALAPSASTEYCLPFARSNAGAMASSTVNELWEVRTLMAPGPAVRV